MIKKKNHDVFWDRRATILNHDVALYRRGAIPETGSNGSFDEISLYGEALDQSGFVSYDELLAYFDIQEYYFDLSKQVIRNSIMIGLFGAIVAMLTDKSGDFIESKFQKFNKLFASGGITNPADYKAGAKHRLFFGHDVLNPFQKLPDGYMYKGVDVGGKSLYKLVTEVYHCGNDNVLGYFTKPISFVWKQFTHYLSDLPTSDGIPLPGSSYFTKWEKSVLNTSGFTARNKLQDSLGKEFGSFHLSDFTSSTVIHILTSSYVKRLIGCADFDTSANKLILNQVKTISYGTGIISQLGLALAGVKMPSAKLNLVLLCAFLKSTSKLVSVHSLENKRLIKGYDDSISILSKSSESVKDWIDSL